MLIIGATVGCSDPVAAQFPSRPIELVVAFPPGGVTDLAARVFAETLAGVLKVPVVVTNRGGGSGVLGATVASQAKKDGYTLLTNSVSGMVLAPAVMKNVSFVPDRDFVPIAMILTVPNSLIVKADSPYETVDDLIDAARQRPGQITYASSGTGSDGHFNAEIFVNKANLSVRHVPFKGGGELVSTVMGGHVDFGVGSMTSYFSFAVAGKVRTLAVTGHTRHAALPNVPTFEERGVSGDFVDSWVGVFAPAGTPQPVVDTLVAGATQATQSRDFVERIEKIGGAVHHMSQEEFLAMIRDQQRTAAAIAARVGMAPQ